MEEINCHCASHRKDQGLWYLLHRTGSRHCHL